MTVPSVADIVAEFSGTFSGRLLRPADAGYEEARRVHNGLVDKRPALIARCRWCGRRGRCHQPRAQIKP